DIGWFYIRILSVLGLAKVRKVAPKLVIAETRPVLDESLLQAIIANRYAIAANYARTLKATVAQEIEQLSASSCLPSVNFDVAKRMKVWLKQDAKDTPATDKIHLELILAQSKVLEQVYQMRQELTRIWERSSLNGSELVMQLQDWCARAEASGIQSLREFSLRLRAVA
ncbi:MAG: DesA/ISL3 alpha bundle tail domain-containing protein, partial [Deefgea sp.]